MAIQGVCKLKQQRMRKGYTQEVLASKVGIDQSFLSKVENAEYFPCPADILVKLVEVLECRYEDIYEDLDRLMRTYFIKVNGKIALSDIGKEIIERTKERKGKSNDKQAKGHIESNAGL